MSTRVTGAPGGGRSRGGIYWNRAALPSVPVLPFPPTMSTLPEASAVALCPLLPAEREELVAVKVPVEGL